MHPDQDTTRGGGLGARGARTRQCRAGHLVKIEIESTRSTSLGEVLAVGLGDAVLIDNMDAATMRKAATWCRRR